VSTELEIQEVYYSDIAAKNRVVREKHGILKFYDGQRDMSVYNIFPDSTLECLRGIAKADAQESDLINSECAKAKKVGE